ncbi:MAG: reverse transcriptase family protein, partial [Pseudomonadota bacterium]|nr:reverse transcriptase family protein [Pseudomonadota bacterium]
MHKKGSKKDPKNYRPISLTSGFSRLFETIIHEKVSSFLISSSKLSHSQFGFLAKRSSESQLLSCLNEWLWTYVNKESLDVIYMDIAKAFDSVSHVKLIKVITSYGIDKNLTNWLNEFLKNRTQRVCIGKTVSQPVKVVSGVPQGGVIGPLLFVIFIDDLCKMKILKDKEVSIKLFADDSKIYSKCPTKLQLALNDSLTWTNNRQLKVAPSKCFQLRISKTKSQLDPEYAIDGMKLQSETAVVDLGVTVTEHLRWDKHIDKIYNKVSATSYQIRNCFKTKNIWVLLKLYITYVRPKLEFNTCVWSPYRKKDIVRLESVQKRFTRSIF